MDIMITRKMKIKRYELTNAADAWSTDGRELQPTPEGHLISPGTSILFVMPTDEED
jgi:hypothetical protein